MQTFDQDVVRGFTAEISSTWIGAASSFTYGLPDVSDLEGFDDTFHLLERAPISVGVSRIDTTSRTYVDGRVSQSASKSTTLGEYCGDGVQQAGETCDPPNGTTCSYTCGPF
jgi:hypothetical protein